MTYLWAFLGACITALVAFLVGRYRGAQGREAEELQQRAKASRERLEADLARRDDAAVQRDAMEGVKPLPPGMGGP